jgi:hypothetical protein
MKKGCSKIHVARCHFQTMSERLGFQEAVEEAVVEMVKNPHQSIVSATEGEGEAPALNIWIRLLEGSQLDHYSSVWRIERAQVLWEWPRLDSPGLYCLVTVAGWLEVSKGEVVTVRCLFYHQR